MKKYMFFLIPLSVFSFDLKGIASAGESLGKYSGYGDKLQSLLQNNTLDIIQNGKLNAMESLTDYILNKTGAGLNFVSGDLLQVCYEYRPTPVKAFNFSFDICEMMGNPKLDPCSLAPNLDKMGYYKKSRTIDLSSYCEIVLGKEPQFETTVEENIKTVNTTKFLGSKSEENIKKTPNKKIEETSLGYKNATNADNKIVKNAILKNDYQTYKILKDIVEASSKDVTKNVDFSNITVEYKKYSDYEDAVQKQADIYTNFEENLNIDRKKQDVLAQLRLVKQDNKASTTSQKDAIIQKALADYRKILKRYEEVEIDRVITLELNDKDRIVYPTQETVKLYSKEDRAKVVYKVEKQKKERAYLISKVKAKIFKMDALFEVELKKTLMHSEEFNEAEERAKILQRLSNVNGE